MSINDHSAHDSEHIARTMPFDQFGRYHMLREAVEACRTKLAVEKLTILDVGGYYKDRDGNETLPITNFLPDDRITVVDMVESDMPGYMKGDGTALVFGDATFDLVVSSDTLEHIPPEQREAFWQELLRVARHGVILLAPFHVTSVEIAEKLLFAYIEAKHQAKHKELQEHIVNGLPVLEEWVTFLEQKDLVVRTYPTGYLYAWLGMMLIKYSMPGLETEMLTDWFYNQTFFSSERREPAYRHLIFAEKTNGLIDAVDAVLAPTIKPPQQDDSIDWGNSWLPLMFTAMQHQLRDQQDFLSGQTQHIIVQNEHLIAQNEHLGRQGEHIFEYSQQSNEQLSQIYTLINEQLPGIYDNLSNQILSNRAHINLYRDEIGMLERIIADQQIALNLLHNTNHHQQLMIHEQQAHIQEKQVIIEQKQAIIEQKQAAMDDLQQRIQWLESQIAGLHRHLEAVQNGRVMRLLNMLTGGK